MGLFMDVADSILMRNRQGSAFIASRPFMYARLWSFISFFEVTYKFCIWLFVAQRVLCATGL